MAGYLGDLKTKTVHHLANMKDECKIVEIKPKYKKYFIPDTIDQAHKEGFSNCSYCV